MFCLQQYSKEEQEYPVKQVVKSYLFPSLISVGYKFLEDPFTNEGQLNHPKMCKNKKYASPVVHSSIVVLS